MTRTYLENFLEIQNYPTSAKTEILVFFDTVQNNSIAKNCVETLEKAYRTDMRFDFSVLHTETEEVANGTGLNLYALRLLVLIAFTEILKDYYEEFNISSEIWFDTVKDILYKAKECFLLHGVWGVCTKGWYMGFYNLSRFAFGRLQFEVGKFGRNYRDETHVVYPTDYVLNVHIPRTETKLDKAEVNASYEKASKFFSKILRKDFTPFVCHSWLLYRVTVKLAGNGSNIEKFASDYDLFEEGMNGDYSEIWRLFDTLYQGDLDALPKDSSLRRKYIEHFKKGGSFGYGYGIYIQDK